jgi:Asp-tRNA(Asn)/Glu-tRNA(Gln) amidotransferase A subunit family amidase
MPDTGPNTLSAAEAARRIAAGTLRCEALVRACLETIAAREPVVGAWAFLDPASALESARALDCAARRGPLHGLPLGVKDIIDTSDCPTAHGSPIYAGNRPRADAACVAAARAAGALVLGKTVSTEFANFHPGRTTNPQDPAHTPGGSSSGSAAAVAAGMVPLALGTQTAGSVIRPAAFCGVVGYKPSFGLIARAGVKPVADSLDTVGMFARTVEDAALLAAVLTGDPALRDGCREAAPRIGLCRTPEWAQAQPEARAALDAAAHALSRAGARLRAFDLPSEFAGLARAQAEIQAHETAHSLAGERLRHPQQLSTSLQAILAQGDRVTAAAWRAHQADAAAARMRLAEACRDVDLLIAPSAPGEAPRGLDSTGDPVFCRMWSLLHAPCIHLPFARGPLGLPVGVQAVAPWGTDARLLATAAWAHDVLLAHG